MSHEFRSFCLSFKMFRRMLGNYENVGFLELGLCTANFFLAFVERLRKNCLCVKSHDQNKSIWEHVTM